MSYGMDNILEEDLSGVGVAKEFYWSGFDRGGRPCLVFRACEHKKTDSDAGGATVEEKVRCFCVGGRGRVGRGQGEEGRGRR